MCLHISPRPVRRPRKPVTVWKVYCKTVLFDKAKFTSPFRGVKASLKEGALIKSNRRRISLTRSEKTSGSISLGLHCFSRKRDAISYANSDMRRGLVVVKCEGAPEDFVASGYFKSRPSKVFQTLRVVKRPESNQ